ncbi:MAG TPA: SCO5918 family protein [Yinghuangia sp.]|uniref:SCO5918 family protein n=1 Tax=Yinghuangia sp. YIM S10712 TaxID=3436930 RepID=UPI002B7E79E3|nr:SCO5918 family protein [Yinghuangia sp.]
MRCVIAGFPFDFTKSGVASALEGVKPEPVTGGSVLIGRRHYPLKQVGAVLTGQDRRDFTAEEVSRAMTRLGFVCSASDAAASTSALTPMQTASALLGTGA